MASAQKQNVVVVGGGRSDVTVAQGPSKKLDHDKFNLIIIEPRPHHIWLPAVARMVVTSDQNFAETAVFPFHRLFAKGKAVVKRDRVVSIKKSERQEDGEPHLASCETLSYRALVLATGSKWSGPIGLPETEADLGQVVSQWRENFKAAEDIVILSGEIGDEYPEKRITIVHARDNPLSDTYPAKYRDCVKAGVTARKVDMVLGEFVEEFPPSGSGDFIFKSEQKLNASRVVVALGPKPNTDFIEESFGPSALTKTKLVKVKKTLQLASHPAIFAVGDIVDWKEQTQAAKAIGHAPVVAANVVNLLAGRPIRNEYGGFPEVIAIANFGKNGRSTLLPFLWGIVLGNFIAAFIKSKSLLIWMDGSGEGGLLGVQVMTSNLPYWLPLS